jgi:hypothetical protein
MKMGLQLQVYIKTMASCPRDLQSHAIFAPRDLKQVANTQFHRRLKSSVSSNGLYSIWLIYIIDDTQFVKRLVIDKDDLMIFFAFKMNYWRKWNVS